MQGYGSHEPNTIITESDNDKKNMTHDIEKKTNDMYVILSFKVKCTR